METSFEEWEIDFSKADEAFLELSKKFSKLEEDMIILDVSGGMRIMGALAIFSAITSLEPRRLAIYMWTEDMRSRADLSFLTYMMLKPIFSDLARKALRVIAENKEINLTKIAQLLGKPKPTVYRAIKELISYGVIKETKKGKNKIYTLDPKGIVLAYDM